MFDSTVLQAPVPERATRIAAQAQERFATDETFRAKCTLVDRLIDQDTANRGFPLTTGERVTARHGVAIALLMSEGGFSAFGL